MPVPIQKSLSHSKPSLPETSLTPEMFLGIIDYLWVLSNSEYFMIIYILRFWGGPVWSQGPGLDDPCEFLPTQVTL